MTTLRVKPPKRDRRQPDLLDIKTEIAIAKYELFSSKPRRVKRGKPGIAK